MKILLCGGTSADTGDAPLLLKRALEKEGCQVHLMSINEERTWMAEVLLAGGFRTHAGVIAHVIAHLNLQLIKMAREYQPDVVFLYGSNVFASPITIRTLQTKLGCQVVLWEVNNRIFGGIQAECVPLYDAIFTLDSYLIPILRVMGGHQISHLCACMDPQEHFLTALSEPDRGRFETDICFMGSPYPNRVEILNQLTGYKLKIYGSKWRNYPALNRFISDEPVMDITKLKIFSGARVSLNIHGEHMINGENFRVFEVAACGGVSFSSPKPDLLRCFEPGAEVVIFEDIDDLHRKLDHYLARPDQLQEIGQAARKRVLAEHTYSHRAQIILSHLGNTQ
jgi:spore maturation protein CgeB